MPNESRRQLRTEPPATERPRSGIESILKNTAYLSAARAVTVAARAFYALLIARVLGPELYGLFNYGLSWYLVFVPLSVLGVNSLLLREIGRRRAGVRDIVEVSLALRSVSSLLVASVCLALGWWVEAEPLNRTLLLVFSVALLGRGLSSWANAVFNGREASGYVLGQELAFRLLEVVAGVALLVAGQGLVVLATVHAAAWLAQGLVGLLVIRRALEPGLRPRWAPRAMGCLVRDGMPLMAGTFLLGWLMQGPVVLYRQLGGDDAMLGQLALALQLFVIVASVLAALPNAALPVLARAAEREDGKTGVFVAAILTSGWLLVGVLGVAGMAVGPWAFSWLFGSAYQAAGALVPSALLLVGPHFWASNLKSVLAAHGRYSAIIGTTLAGAMVFTALFPLLMSSCDMRGALLAAGLGLTTVVIGQLWLFCAVGSVNLERAFVRPGLVTLAALGACAGLLPLGPCAALLGGICMLMVASLLLKTVPWRQAERILVVRR